MELYFIIMFLATLGILLPIIIKHKRVNNGIINYNNSMTKYVYKVNLSKTEILKLLKGTSEFDELSCTFNEDETIIKFSTIFKYIIAYLNFYVKFFVTKKSKPWKYK